MKIISWNVNGIRSNIVDWNNASYITPRNITSNSAIQEIIEKDDPDVICFQETRLGTDKYSLFDTSSINAKFKYRYWSSSQGSGARSGNRYSGVSIWSKKKPISIKTHLDTLYINEGRFIQVNFDNCIIINTYTPNYGSNAEYRINVWEPAIKKYLKYLHSVNCLPIIYCSDNNVANRDDVWFGSLLDKKSKYLNSLQEPQNGVYDNIDEVVHVGSIQERNKIRKLVNSKKTLHSGKKKQPGYTKEEQSAFALLLQSVNLCDVYKTINPGIIDKFTWFNIRNKHSFTSNKGWLIDRFLIHKKYVPDVLHSDILYYIGIKKNDKLISDHLPIMMEITV